MRKLVVVVFVVSLALAAAGGDKPKPKAKGQVVDSGSFGIYVSGRRVATEKFEIVQRAEGSTASTELITDEAKAKPSQSTELQMSPNGDLLRYTWRDLESTKAQAVVEPNNEFLIEHATPTPQAKTEDTPFLMPHSTVILDDYAFIAVGQDDSMFYLIRLPTLDCSFRMSPDPFHISGVDSCKKGLTSRNEPLRNKSEYPVCFL